MYRYTMNNRDEISGPSRAERAMLQQILDMNERIVNINQSISDRLLRSSRQENNRVYLSGIVGPHQTHRNLYAYYPHYPVHNNRTAREEESNAAAALLNLLMGNMFQANANVPPTNTEIGTAITCTTFGELSEEIRSAQPTCPITHESFSLDTEVALVIGCQHVFNRAAAIRWLRSNGTCPVCRYDIRQNNDTSNPNNNQNPDNSRQNNGRQYQRANVLHMGLPSLDSLFTFN